MKFAHDLHLCPHFLRRNSEGSGECARVHRLARGFACRLGDTNRFLTGWLKWSSMTGAKKVHIKTVQPLYSATGWYNC